MVIEVESISEVKTLDEPSRECVYGNRVYEITRREPTEIQAIQNFPEPLQILLMAVASGIARIVSREVSGDSLFLSEDMQERAKDENFNMEELEILVEHVIVKFRVKGMELEKGVAKILKPKIIISLIGPIADQIYKDRWDTIRKDYKKITEKGCPISASLGLKENDIRIQFSREKSKELDEKIDTARKLKG